MVEQVNSSHNSAGAPAPIGWDALAETAAIPANEPVQAELPQAEPTENEETAPAQTEALEELKRIDDEAINTAVRDYIAREVIYESQGPKMLEGAQKWVASLGDADKWIYGESALLRMGIRNPSPDMLNDSILTDLFNRDIWESYRAGGALDEEIDRLLNGLTDERREALRQHCKSAAYIKAH